MVFHFQKVSDHGTSIPAVARTFIRGSEILNLFDADKEKKVSASLVPYELQRHMVKCTEIRDGISDQVKAARSEAIRNDFAAHFPQHAVSRLLGHGIGVSERHYLQVPGDLYDRASPLNPCEKAVSGQQRAANALQHGTVQRRTKPLLALAPESAPPARSRN